MIKRIGTAVLLILTAATSWAQNKDTLNTQMEVRRDYEPVISEAAKIDITPNLDDTVKLRPEVKYDLKQFIINNNFGLKPIKAVGVNVVKNKYLNPFYLKAGLGFPFQSVLDFSYSHLINHDAVFTGYVNHYGEYGKRQNDMKFDAPVFMNNDHVGVGFAKNWARKSLITNIEYGYDNYTRYGFFSPDGLIPADFGTSRKDLSQYYNSVHFNAGFGDNFKDISRLNYMVGADVFYYGDKFGDGSTDMAVSLALARLFGKRHTVTLNAQFDKSLGFGDLNRNDKTILTIKPSYAVNWQGFGIQIGIDNYYVISEKRNYFFPTLNLKKTIFKGAMEAYLDVDSEIYSSDYRANPYLAPSIVMPISVDYKQFIGIKGSIKECFEYNVFAGYTFNFNKGFYANLYDSKFMGNAFDVIVGDAGLFSVGAELKYKIIRDLHVYTNLLWNGFNTTNSIPAYVDTPKFIAELGTGYRFNNRISVGIAAKVLGQTTFYNKMPLEITTNTIGVRIDLSVKAEYEFTKKISGFGELNNIANAKLYQYNRFKLMGINGVLGVKYRF